MNDNLSQALAAVLTRLSDVVMGIKNITMANLPSLVKQLIEYNSIKDTIIIIISFCVLVFCYLCGKKVVHNNSDGVDLALCVLGGLISIGVIFIYGFDLLQIVVAPQIWIINYTKDLLHG